jgi:hypothetical protein
MTSCWILLRMRNVWDASSRETNNVHFLFNNLFQKFCCYEVMWKNVVEADRPQMKLYNSACELHAGYQKLQTHLECVRILAFLQQQWLYECFPVLCYMCIVYVIQFYKVVFSLIFFRFCDIYSPFSDITASLVSLPWVWHLWQYSLVNVGFWCSKDVVLSKSDAVY